MFSFFRKIKKNKTPPNPANCEQAEDALKENSTKPNIEPEKCIASEVWVNYSTQRTNVTLVQGSSDSKPVKQSFPKYERPSQTSSIRRDFRENITPTLEITSVQHVHRAPSVATAVKSYSKLYPSLDPSSTHGDFSSVKKTVNKVKKLVSIHDISDEICFRIQQNILDAIKIEKKLDQLIEDAKTKVIATKNRMNNSSKLEYTFDKELEVSQTYSHDTIYDKIHSFNEVKSRHQRMKEPSASNISNTEAAPIFQSYRQEFRCYRGKKNDIVNCD